jgi:hypothetical protein
MVGSQPAQVHRTRSCDDRTAETNAGRYDDRIDGRPGPCTSPKLTGEASGSTVERQPTNTVDEQPVDADVTRIASIHLRQHRQREDPLGTLALSPARDGKRSIA